MGAAAVDIQQLGFSYSRPPHTCFSNFNLKIQTGERFGLFGPNGAGKTTLLHCMTGLLSYQNGSITLLGYDLKKNSAHIKRLIGVVPQDFAFYQELSPKENLQFFGALSGMNKQSIRKRSDELLSVLGLTEVRDQPVLKFSGGMKRKVNLAIGVLPNPPLLFLDEPTVGVDIQTRRSLVDYLKELNRQGTTLIYTSHQLGEAQDLCTTVALIDQGNLMAHDSPDRLFLEHGEKDLEGLFIKLTGKKNQEVHV